MNLKLLFCVAIISLSLNCFCQDSNAGKSGSKTVKETLARDSAKILDSLKDELKEASFKINRLERDLKSARQIKNPTGEDNDNDFPLFLTQIGLGITIFLAIVFLAAAVVFYFKIKKMESEKESLKSEGGIYKAYLEQLRKNLQKNNLLRAGDDVSPILVIDTASDIISQYMHDQELKKKEAAGLTEKNGQPEPAPAPIINTVEKIVSVQYVEPPATSYIKSEILLSAGPRKDSANKDTELGEDVAGLISFPRQTFFWLLDGTSDSAAIKSLEVAEDDNRHQEYHVFSSRLLAQSIGHYMQSNIHNLPIGKPLGDWLIEAIDSVKNEWEARINDKESEERKEPIRQLIRQGYKPLCSTTILFGRLLENGQLYVLRTGDSKVFPFKKLNGDLKLDKEFKFASDPTDEYDRIAFRLDLTESGSFIIRRNEPKWAAKTVDDVQMVFAFSDGIGRITEAQLSSDKNGIVESIRQSIARIPQKTYDDKTLIILERIFV